MAYQSIPASGGNAPPTLVNTLSTRWDATFGSTKYYVREFPLDVELLMESYDVSGGTITSAGFDGGGEQVIAASAGNTVFRRPVGSGTSGANKHVGHSNPAALPWALYTRCAIRPGSGGTNGYIHVIGWTNATTPHITPSVGSIVGLIYRADHLYIWAHTSAGASTTVDTTFVAPASPVMRDHEIRFDGAAIQYYLDGVATGPPFTVLTNVPATASYVYYGIQNATDASGTYMDWKNRIVVGTNQSEYGV